MNNHIAKTKPHKSKPGLALASLVALALLLVVPMANADITKTFNATHSLTGDCATSSKDPVPDPGCPGGIHPPEGKLIEPSAVATDRYGNIYVVNRNDSQGAATRHLDIFDSGGNYIGGFANDEGLLYVAVDSTGHLYTVNEDADGISSEVIYRYDPTVYEPQAANIVYGDPPVVVDIASLRVVVDPANDHVYVKHRLDIVEYGPPTDGVPNTLLVEGIGNGVLRDASFTIKSSMALDRERGRIYVIDSVGTEDATAKNVVRVFEDSAPYGLIETIDGSTTPAGNLGAPADWYRFSLVADEATGHLFVANSTSLKKIYEFDAGGAYIGTINKPTMESQDAQFAIDNSEDSPNQGYLYAPNGIAVGALLAYEGEPIPKPPVVEALSTSGVTEDETALTGKVNPRGQVAHWRFEYTTEQAFQAEGFAAATVGSEGDLPKRNEGLVVTGVATGLQPGTTYRFRLVAENDCEPGGCTGEDDGTFTTFATDPQSADPCPNQALRTGASALLPDCRAYELVTPANTGGLRPLGPNRGASGPAWPTAPAAPSGQSIAFTIIGGLIPGMEATGGPTEIGDVYLSKRTAAGWQTAPKSPNGTQATLAYNGGLSPDHGYAAFEVAYQGTLLINEERANYVRYPDGSFHLAGAGSLADDLQAEMIEVTAGGSHIFTSSSEQLEPGAPAAGTDAIYDRTADGVQHVVSLLPEDVTPEAGRNARYAGISDDGSVVAFSLDGVSPGDAPTGPLYLRLDNTETRSAAPPGSEFAGLSADGSYLFYFLSGDIYRYDVAEESVEQITVSGDTIPVNVGDDGTGAYFISHSVLPVGPNPRGAEAQPGGFNLYHWDGSVTHFVATVTERDTIGDDEGFYDYVVGLGHWLGAQGNYSEAILTSRTNPDASTLLFASRADLTGFESDGAAQIYRYDADADTLDCLSCSRVGAAPGGDAELILTVASRFANDGEENALDLQTPVANLSPDGERAFFESAERLLATDNDGLADVYEWEAEGKGTCAKASGCLFLITSGQSARAEHLYGVSESGDDVFIRTGELLLPEDTDATPSIYDVRVNGGFPPAPRQAGECLGEACQPAAVRPEDPSPASSSYAGPGNAATPASSARKCPKGKRNVKKRNVKKASKARCVSRKRATKRQKKQNHGTRRAHR